MPLCFANSCMKINEKYRLYIFYYLCTYMSKNGWIPYIFTTLTILKTVQTWRIVLKSAELIVASLGCLKSKLLKSEKKISDMLFLTDQIQLSIRGRFILVIFKSIWHNDTIYFFSFTLEALWIFPKLVLFQPICPNSTRPHQNYKSLEKIYKASRVKLKK